MTDRLTSSLFTPPALQPFDPAVEEAAHQRMLELGPQSPAALTTLMAGLGDPSWRVRKAAQSAVVRFDISAPLLRALIMGLGSEENAGLRNSCAEVLMRLGSAAVPELATALETGDPDQRKFVVEVLGAIGTDAALAALLATLDQSDSNVGAAVVDALGSIGGVAVIAALQARLPAARGQVQLSAYLLDY